MIDTSQISSLTGIEPLKLLELFSEYAPKIKAIVPKVIAMLPDVKEWEKTHELKKGEIIMYSAICTQTNVYIYVNKALENEAGNVEIIEQVQRVDIMEMMKKLLAYIPD